MGERPNFLFFITDQHRADFLGCTGHPVLKTPHIDGVAADGTRFDRFFVASPVCMPNRASLMTGRYPSAHGLRHNGSILSVRANCFTDVLREGGYRTALIGKSHIQPMTDAPAYRRVDPDCLGPIDEAWKDDGGDYGQEQPERWRSRKPLEMKLPFYGFDHVDLITGHGDHCGGHYYQWLRDQTPDADRLRDRANQLPHGYVCPQAIRTPIPEELYTTFYVRDRAIEYVQEAADGDQPFFACISFPDPHHPFTPPGRYWDMYDPGDMPAPLPFEAHKNPPPHLKYIHDQLMSNARAADGQRAFMAHEHEIREAMALTCGMITMIDDAIGAVLEALRRTGRSDDTVIIFTSDHGDYLGDFGLLLKGTAQFRSITRVPFIWSDPIARQAALSDAFGSTLDIGPSIIERAGLKPYYGIQGRSVLPCLDGTTQIRDELMVEFYDGGPRMGFEEPAEVRTLLTDDHRLSFYRDQDWGELYDLRNDPNETENLWDDPGHASIRSALTERLVNHMLAAVDHSPHALRRA